MKILCSILILLCLFSTSRAQAGEPPIKAPFEGIDVLATGRVTTQPGAILTDALLPAIAIPMDDVEIIFPFMVIFPSR